MAKAFSHAEYKYRRKKQRLLAVLHLARAQREILGPFKEKP